MPQVPWYRVYIWSSFVPAYYCVYSAVLELLSATTLGLILNLLLRLCSLLYKLVCSHYSKVPPARWSHSLMHSQFLWNRKGLGQFLKRGALGIFVKVKGLFQNSSLHLSKLRLWGNFLIFFFLTFTLFWFWDKIHAKWINFYFKPS